MALLRKFFNKKRPDGLLEISERVFVFRYCFTTNLLDDDEYKIYIQGIVGRLHHFFPKASYMVFNFREGMNQTLIANILSEYDMTVVDYPRHYFGCPLLALETIYHFLKSSDSWLSLGNHNMLLMNCERGGWPVLAFMLSCLLTYRKHNMDEQRTLDWIYKHGPNDILSSMSPLNPIPSQVRYLQYVSKGNISQWLSLDQPFTLDCVILRVIPDFDGEGGCRPIFRIYGQDPLTVGNKTPKVLFSSPKKSKLVRHIKQADCELVKIDIRCYIQGDVVIECISLDDDLEGEKMMFRVMFNTSFIKANILMLSRDDIDMLWNCKDRFSKEFSAEVLFSDMDDADDYVSNEVHDMEEKDGLPMEAFAKVQEFFSNVDWLDTKTDVALDVLQQIVTSSVLQEKLEASSPNRVGTGKTLRKLVPENHKTEPSSEASENHSQNPGAKAELGQFMPTVKVSADLNSAGEKVEPQEQQVADQPSAQSKVISQRSAQPEVGISTLLPDHGALNGEEVIHQPKLNMPIATPPAPHPPPESTSSSGTSSVVNDSPAAPFPPQPPPSGRAPSSTPVPPPPPPLSAPPPPPPPSLPESSANCAPPPPPQPITSSAPGPPPPPPPSMNSGPGPGPPPPPPGMSSGPGPPPPPPPGMSSGPGPPPPPPPGMSSGPGPPPPPPPGMSSGPGPPPPPPPPGGTSSGPGPPPPPPPGGTSSGPGPPPPPAPGGGPRSGPGPPGPPPPRGKAMARSNAMNQTKKSNLKPYHWLKLTRAAQGSLWDETQKTGSNAPPIDMSELESLFSVASPPGTKPSKPKAPPKPEKVQLIDLRRANNCEIMLSKVKIPLSELVDAVLALDESTLDIDQIENFIKFSPTKEEMETLNNYTGDKEKLGKCEVFFLELMRVPRVESKLRVFSFKMQFLTQAFDLRNNLNVVNAAAQEVKNSPKLKRVMKTILSLGNALNAGTARGSAVGFKLDSLPKLTDTRAKNGRMTLMHYLCKVIAEKLPELLDFPKDLGSLEGATKVQLKYLAEEMQAISKGLDKVVQELKNSEKDGAISEEFCKHLRDFLGFAEAEVSSLTSIYAAVGRSADGLAVYFGEDPARCPFEQVVTTLLSFARTFERAHQENLKEAEAEKKKALKEAQEKKKNDAIEAENKKKEAIEAEKMKKSASDESAQNEPEANDESAKDAQTEKMKKGGNDESAETEKMKKGGNDESAETEKMKKGGNDESAETEKMKKGGNDESAETEKMKKGGNDESAETEKMKKGGNDESAETEKTKKGGNDESAQDKRAESNPSDS